MVPAGLDDEALRNEAFSDSRIKEHIGDRTPKKVIIVRGRLVNIVI